MLADFRKSAYGLVFVMAFASTIQWITTKLGEKWIGKISASTLLLMDSLISVFFVLAVLAVSGGDKIRNAYAEMKKVEPLDLLLLTLFTIAGLFTSYLVISLLKHHPTHKIRISEFVADIVISALAVFIIKRGEMSLREVGALALIAAGGFLFVKVS